MIKKLSKRIFLLMMTSLSTVVLGIIILFANLNYRNTINTATSMMDRFANGETKKNINNKLENEIINPRVDIDGLYYIQVEDSKVIENSNTYKDKTIEEYAIKVSKGNQESGIIGNYIYKIRKTKNNTANVILMENEEAILHSKKIIIVSIIVAVLSLIIIYIIVYYLH